MPDSQTRLDLARRLHDGLAQELARLGYRLDEVIGDPVLAQSHRDALRAVRLEFTSISQHFRDEIYRIRLLDREEIRHQMPDILAKINHSLDLDFPPLISRAEDALGHCLIEIARNCAEHAGSNKFTLSWLMDKGKLVVRCTDDGTGLIGAKERSFGLLGIHEWLASIDSVAEIESSKAGTTIMLTIHTSNFLLEN